MKEFIGSIVEALIPPRDGEDRMYKWRVAVSLSIALLTITLAGHLLYAAGALPGYENEAFVARNDLNQLADVTLTKAIYEAKKEQCSAPAGSKARSTYSQLVDRYVRQYKELTGIVFDEPECDDL